MKKLGEVSINFVLTNFKGEKRPATAIFHNAIISLPKDIHINGMKFIDDIKPDIKIEGWESADLYVTMSNGEVIKERTHSSKSKWYKEEEH